MVATGQIPSQLSLRTLANFHFCGGALLTTQWAVTSAACTANRGHGSINVVAGTVRLDSGGVTRRSLRIVQHPGYRHLTLENDISLIQTEAPFQLSVDIQTITLGIAHLQGGVNVQVSLVDFLKRLSHTELFLIAFWIWSNKCVTSIVQ
jgi:hypothetical protein